MRPCHPFVEAMTHEVKLLLAADQTPLAERDLLAPAESLVYYRCRRDGGQGIVFVGVCSFVSLFVCLFVSSVT